MRTAWQAPSRGMHEGQSLFLSWVLLGSPKNTGMEMGTLHVSTLGAGEPPQSCTCCRWPSTLVLQSNTPLPSEEYRLYRNSVV